MTKYATIILTILMLTMSVHASNIYYDIPLSHELQDYTMEVCDELNVPIQLVYAIIEVESNFTPDIISKTNDYGYMQINECNKGWVYEQFGIDNLLDPYDNIYVGVYMMSQALDSQDTIHKAIMVYGSGPTGARQKYFDKGIYENWHSKKVIKAMNNLMELKQTDI